MLIRMIYLCSAAIFLGVGSASAQSCPAEDRLNELQGSSLEFDQARSQAVHHSAGFPRTCQGYQSQLDSTFSYWFLQQCNDFAKEHALYHGNMNDRQDAWNHCLALSKTVNEAGFDKVRKCRKDYAEAREKLEEKFLNGDASEEETEAYLEDEGWQPIRDCFYNVHSS